MESNPLSAEGEERVVERSKDRVSPRSGLINLSTATHPDIAALVDPLFRKRERGLEFVTPQPFADQAIHPAPGCLAYHGSHHHYRRCLHYKPVFLPV